MAAVREIWDLFQNNLRKYNVPSDTITVGEQLYGYRSYAPGRCYMKSKPAKYWSSFTGCVMLKIAMLLLAP